MHFVLEGCKDMLFKVHHFCTPKRFSRSLFCKKRKQCPGKGRLNLFTRGTILDQTKLKVFADDKLNVTKVTISVFDRVENIVGKGEITCISSFFFSPQCFQKASFPDPSKGALV